jgi:hypothetical protein
MEVKTFDQFITEQTTELYHGSFRPRIEKFFMLTHVGDYECAVNRLKDLKENDPDFKDQLYGFIYRVTADISNPATVKDHTDVADPGVISFDKFYRWADELKTDSRIKNGKIIENGKEFSAENRMDYVKKLVERGWWFDFGDTEKQAAKSFINYFVFLLNSVGITSLLYKNEVECPGNLSYIILNPRNNMKIVGRAKQISLE